MERIEEWRPVVGFPGYEISNNGRVRSYKMWKAGRNKKRDTLVDKPRLMSIASDDGNGYLKVILRKNGKAYCRKVHRLVAEAFIHNDDPVENDTVDHISNNKKDNRVENLRWVSRHDNVSMAYSDGLHKKDIENRRRAVWLTDIFTDQEFYFDSMLDAADFLGVHYTTLCHAMRNGIDGFVHEYCVRFLDDNHRRYKIK